MGFVWIVLGYRGETCELCLVLATGVRHVSYVWSSYRGETCKLVALCYSWVTKVQCHAYSCLGISAFLCDKLLIEPFLL
jgi:hypothetical protein